jgi:Flp pilus assembly protein TadD
MKYSITPKSFKRAIPTSCIFLLTTMLSAVAAAHEPARPYQLTVIADDAKGERIMDGDYQTAIASINNRDVTEFSEANNLCVAYTMNGETTLAADACDKALALVESQPRTVSTPKDLRRSLAVALSNRGVYKALSGDTQGAKVDLSRAVGLRANLRQATQNLSRLASTESVAS